MKSLVSSRDTALNMLSNKSKKKPDACEMKCFSDIFQVEGTGKQSIYKFIKVLEGLREWEICSPDISAAIEFCREHIVEMTIEEYESWFTQRFPKITRPQTAPPAPKTDKKNESKVSSAVSTRRVMPKRATQSAFTRRVQR